MAKFPKGSEEAKQYMKELRERRKSKPLTELQISRNNKKQEVQTILNDALDKYFVAGSGVVEVPDKIVKVDNKGNAKVMDTLTKSGALKKVNGESVIKLEPGNDLIVKNKGRQYHDSEVVNVPKQTITHNKTNKTNRNKKFDGVEKNNDDTIEFDNVEIQSSKRKPYNWPDDYYVAKEEYNELIKNYSIDKDKNYSIYHQIGNDIAIMNKTEYDFIDHLKNDLKKELITEDYFDKVNQKVENAYNERQKMESKLLNLRNEKIEKLRNKKK